MWTLQRRSISEKSEANLRRLQRGLAMKRHQQWGRSPVLFSAAAAALWGAAAVWGLVDQWSGDGRALALEQASERQGDDREKRDEPQSATRSSPIAITSDNKYVWSVNPDNDSVSVFRVAKDKNKKVDEIRVGKEPWCVALTPGKPQRDDGRKHKDDDDDKDNGVKAYVTNMVSGTVTVINADKRKVIETIKVGAEPFGCALTPDGRTLYVANQSSETVSVIDTEHDRVIATIKHVGTKPHGIAITADGAKVYVTQFLSQRPGPQD